MMGTCQNRCVSSQGLSRTERVQFGDWPESEVSGFFLRAPSRKEEKEFGRSCSRSLSPLIGSHIAGRSQSGHVRTRNRYMWRSVSLEYLYLIHAFLCTSYVYTDSQCLYFKTLLVCRFSSVYEQLVCTGVRAHSPEYERIIPSSVGR